MSTLIPGSAFKFYAESGHTTVVNGGAAPGQTLYPKLDASFVEDYTTRALTIALPFTGRGVLTVNKTFTEGVETKGLVASLVGTESLAIDLQLVQGETPPKFAYTGAGVVDVTNPATGAILIPKSAGDLQITLKLNNAKLLIVPNFTRGAINQDMGGITLNAAVVLAMGAEYVNTEFFVPDDIGYVTEYQLYLEIGFPENTTTNDIACGSITILNGTSGAIVTVLNITQDGQSVSISPSSITLNKATGVGSSPISVVAQSAWTVA